MDLCARARCCAPTRSAANRGFPCFRCASNPNACSRCARGRNVASRLAVFQHCARFPHSLHFHCASTQNAVSRLEVFRRYVRYPHFSHSHCAQARGGQAKTRPNALSRRSLRWSCVVDLRWRMSGWTQCFSCLRCAAALLCMRVHLEAWRMRWSDTRIRFLRFLRDA